MMGLTYGEATGFGGLIGAVVVVCACVNAGAARLSTSNKAETLGESVWWVIDFKKFKN